MMNENRRTHIGKWQIYASDFLCAAMIFVALFSWLGSIYGIPLQNLLCADGVRWMLRHAVADFQASPVVCVLVLLFGGGIVVRSGLCKALSQGVLHLSNFSGHSVRLSLRQRRSLMLAVFVLIVYVSMVLAGVYGSHGFLLGIKGDFTHSPLVAGLPILLSAGMGLVGGIYGFSAGSLQTVGDLLQGALMLISRAASTFVLMFLGSLWLSMLDYTAMDFLIGVEHGTWGRTLIELFIFWGFPLASLMKM